MDTTTATNGAQDVANIMTRVSQFEAINDFSQALAILKNALLADPNGKFAFILWFEHGRLLAREKSWLQAEASFRVAISQSPNLAQAHLAIGSALEAQNKIDEAIKYWNDSLQPIEFQVQTLNNIGRVNDAHFKYEEAEGALSKSYALNPNQPEVLATLLFLRKRLCIWPISRGLNIDAKQLKGFYGPLCSMAEFDDPSANLESVSTFIKAKGYDKTPKVRAFQSKKKQARIKLGFISADFRLHATSIFFTHLLESIDREKFEVYAFDITSAPELIGDLRKRILKAVDHHVPLQELTDDDASELIHSLNIDILIDMAVLTAGARPGIVAAHPAGIQISYLGFIASSGMDAMDYVLTTHDLFSEQFAEAYVEKPLYLPNTYVAMERQYQIVETLTKQSVGLPDNVFVYCALLNSYKITPHVFDCWMNILSKVENSILWLIEENKTAKENLIEEAKSRGITSDRLIFTPRIPPEYYRAYLKLADLFLDTSPYGNGATAHDAILVNLPILTCPGNTMMSRLTSHLMRHAGYSDFVVNSWEEYQAKGIDYGLNPNKLVARKLENVNFLSNSDLFDTTKFAREFEETLLSVLN